MNSNSYLSTLRITVAKVGVDVKKNALDIMDQLDFVKDFHFFVVALQ
jgi:predicted nucleic acid-binding protein